VHNQRSINTKRPRDPWWGAHLPWPNLFPRASPVRDP
jgi:hypothetical protein